MNRNKAYNQQINAQKNQLINKARKKQWSLPQNNGPVAASEHLVDSDPKADPYTGRHA
nr:hypothetical protein Q903MT_gene1348 [Picea sitchensis]